MQKTITIFIFLLVHLFSFGQDDFNKFKRTFHSDFFDFKMHSFSNKNSLTMKFSYQGEHKYDSPRIDVLIFQVIFFGNGRLSGLHTD